MDDASIWERLTEVFRETFGDDRIQIAAETVADDIEGWDSIMNIQLLVSIEREFGVRFNTGEVAGLTDVGALVEKISHQARQ